MCVKKDTKAMDSTALVSSCHRAGWGNVIEITKLMLSQLSTIIINFSIIGVTCIVVMHAGDFFAIVRITNFIVGA